MSNASVFSSLQNISAKYRSILREIPEAHFQVTPPIGGWSYSEVYSHIFDASILSLIPLKTCLSKIGEQKPTALIVRLILLYGRLPPVKKYKVPKRLESRVKKISKEEAENYIVQFLAELGPAYLEMDKSDKKIKNLHPRLGYLNASQWLRFIEIHLKHHLKQLKRIEKSF